MSERVNQPWGEQPIPKFNEQIVSPEEHLNGMREFLRTHNNPLYRSNIPEHYQEAAHKLEQVHQAHVDFDPTGAMADSSPTKLLSNFIRYAEHLRTASNTEIDLSLEFFCGFYDSYAKDVEVFSQALLPNIAVNAALYNNFGVLVGLRDTYDGHDFITNSDIAAAFNYGIRDPRKFLIDFENSVCNFRDQIEPTLREEYGLPGQWDINTVKRLCWKAYPEDAARQIFGKTVQVIDKYPETKRTTIETIVKEGLITGGKKAQYVEKLLSEVQIIEADPEELITAEGQLNQLRKAKINNFLFRGDPEVIRLLRAIDVSQRESFNNMDLDSGVRYLFASVRTYNRHIIDRPDFAIKDSPQNIYNLLCVFADDVRALKAEALPAAAEKVARFHEPGVYDSYKEKYKHDPALTPGRIERLVSEAQGDVDQNIQKYIAKFNFLMEKFGTSINKGSIRGFAMFSDGEKRIKQCLAFAEYARDKYPWASKRDIETFFYKTKDPEIAFENWVNKIEALISRYPRDKRFTRPICKIIAMKSDNLDEIITRYMGRHKELSSKYKNHPLVPEDYCIRWAATRPKSYTEAAEKYLLRVGHLTRLFETSGEAIDYTSIQSIAFNGNNAEYKFNKYLDIKNYLKQSFEGDDFVEEWMINQAASSSNTESYASAKLKVLCRLKQQGVFNVYMDSVRDNAGSFHETLADTNPNSIPENAILQMEEHADRQDKINDILSKLNHIDRQAVEIVFGFSDDFNEKALLDELGIEDLEDYVMNSIIPKLKL